VNTLTGRLYDIFSKLKSLKEIWAILETHHRQKKLVFDYFLVLKFVEYEITNNKTITDQVHEIQMLVSKFSGYQSS